MGSGAYSLTGMDTGEFNRRPAPRAAAARVNSIDHAIEISKEYIALGFNNSEVFRGMKLIEAQRVGIKDDDRSTLLRPSEDAEGLLANADFLICEIKDCLLEEHAVLEEPLSPMMCSFVLQTCLSVHRVRGRPIAAEVVTHVVLASIDEIMISMAGHLSVEELLSMLQDIDWMFREGELTLQL